MTTGMIIFCVFLAIMVAIGLVTARLQHSTTAFWVADRNFGVPILAIAILVSIMHGGSLIGGAGAIGSWGAITTNNLSFALGFVVVLFFMAEKLRNFGGFTLPDFLGARYESSAMRQFSAFVVLVAAVVSLIAQTKAMGVVVMQLSGLNLTWALIITTSIFVFYTTIGGMMAAIWTDIVQWLFMIVGIGALLVVVMPKVGGISGMAATLNTLDPKWTTITGSWSWTGILTWYLVWFIAYFTRIEFVTKMYVAKDVRTAKRATAWGLVLVLIFFSSIVFLGGAARILVWDNLGNPDQALPVLISTYLSPFWEAFALAGVAAASMSTVSSLLLLSGAAIAHDFLRKTYYEPRGIEKSEKFYLRASQFTLLGVGIIALLGALNTPTLILTIVSYAVALSGAAFAMPILLGLTWKRTTPVAALWSSVAGFCGTALWAILIEMGHTELKAVHPIFPGLVLSIVIIVALSLLTRPASAAAVDVFFPKKQEKLS